MLLIRYEGDKEMNEKQSFSVIKYIIPCILLLVVFAAAYLLLGTEFMPFFKWWMMLLLLGVIFLPISSLFFSKFHDAGWLFSKTIGIACSGWLLWYLNSLKILKFTAENARIVVTICFLINILVLVWQLKKRRKSEFNVNSLRDYITREKVPAILFSESLFFLLFFVWVYMRGFKPEAYGTEKFMDYGFMTTMMRSDYMPAEDLWFSGNVINYYYVGQYLSTYLTKLSGVTVGYGYNLMLMTIAAFGFTLPYGLMYNVSKVFIKDLSLKKRNTGRQKVEVQKVSLHRAFPCTTGLLAGIAVCFAGNLHYPIYNWVIRLIDKIRGVETTNYWFPDATRYIGYNPETTDKTIHEFPLYSFVLGDLHAHVINIMFVLTVLALLFSFLLYRKEKMDELRFGLSIVELPFVKEVFHPIIIALGFFIGLFRTTNFWDFPIYFVVAGAIILFSNGIVFQFKKKAILLTASHAAVILVIAEIVAFPFTRDFNQISTKLCFTVARTPFYQLCILWGLPILLIGMYVIQKWNHLREEGYIYKVIKPKKQEKKGKIIKDATLTETMEEKRVLFVPEKAKILQFIENLPIAELFIITIGLCAIGLILMPEVVYVQDIYSGDYKRANTMFKLTYQAYIMFGMCMAFIILKLVLAPKNRKQRVIGIISALLLFSTVCYAKNAIHAWFGNVFKSENFKTLDASAFMETESYADYLATNWLNENVEGKPVVLEAPGDSYTFYERVSVITGLPTIMGWKTHEWLWRSDETGAYPAACQKREDDIKIIYTSTDVNAVKELLTQYKVVYIYVGALEREKYPEINEELLKSLGEVVFEYSEDTSAYIIKID